MKNTGAVIRCLIISVLLMAVAGCSSTKHLDDGKYLLRRNAVKLKTNGIAINKGETRDYLARLVVQRPNTYRILGSFPLKLWSYNARYAKMHNLPDSLLPKTVERPVVLDTALLPKTILNMRSFLFNQGYFYAKVTDTVIYKKKKAYVIYNVTSGINYLINIIQHDVDDSGIATLMQHAAAGSVLKKNKVFSYSQLDEERGRLVSVIRNAGYYKFSLENIRFEIDTMDKAFLRDIDNPLESAINFIALTHTNKKPTIDVKIIVRTKEDTTGIPYRIAKVTVYPDYQGVADTRDNSQLEYTIDSILFRYHENYVHARVLADRIYMQPGQLYSQENQDKTIAKLNELGIFQYIRIQTVERPDSTLLLNIFLSRTKKLDFKTNFEVSNGGSTYSLGNSLGASFQNKNFAKGANLLSVSLNAGIELGDSLGNRDFKRITMLTQYYGFNTSLDFPKFIAPLPKGLFDNSNLPHTIISAGSNVINRVQYFTLTNTSASFKYNWRESQTQVWEFSPAFVNIIKLGHLTPAFQEKLRSSQFLSNSYREIFIEGENISYTFSNIEKKKGRNYFRIKLGMEEAGGLLAGINSILPTVIDFSKNPYAQYVKFDFDGQRFVSLPHSSFALRFYGGIGLPNGHTSSLPYVKQYYVGGPYSTRGWRIRTLGPGSYYDSSSAGKINTIDRTGDIKLEFNGEYRFPILPLFAGLIKMNGALFTDAGNMWLARKDTSRAGGEFALSKLGQDIAMDVGAGTRFDIASFLTLRLDVAMPVKKPYIPVNNGWVLDAIDFKNPTWRSNNIIVNLSIGYPF